MTENIAADATPAQSELAAKRAAKAEAKAAVKAAAKAKARLPRQPPTPTLPLKPNSSTVGSPPPR